MPWYKWMVWKKSFPISEAKPKPCCSKRLNRSMRLMTAPWPRVQTWKPPPKKQKSSLSATKPPWWLWWPPRYQCKCAWNHCKVKQKRMRHKPWSAVKKRRLSLHPPQKNSMHWLKKLRQPSLRHRKPRKSSKRRCKPSYKKWKMKSMPFTQL